MTTQDVISIIGLVFSFFSMIATVVMAIATIFLFCLGKQGLEQWRKELKGKDQYELARKIALLAYQFKSDYDFVRMFATFGEESSDRAKPEGESFQETSIRNEYYAKSQRLERLRLTVIKLQEADWEAKSTLGSDTVGKCQE